MSNQPGLEPLNLCPCIKCVRDRKETIGHIPAEFARMIVCPICGNKRCPHASDHNYACTHSNEPGQAGSIYT